MGLKTVKTGIIQMTCSEGKQANIEKIMVPPNEEFVEQFQIALGALAQ